MKIISLSNLMQTISTKWLVSYDFVQQIDEMYNNYSKIVYGINYSAQNRYQGTEVIFFSDGLIIPDINDPTKTKTKKLTI